jgi:hypothetical protein
MITPFAIPLRRPTIDYSHILRAAIFEIGNPYSACAQRIFRMRFATIHSCRRFLPDAVFLPWSPLP